MNDVTPTPMTPAQMIDTYIQYRDAKKVAEAAIEQHMKDTFGVTMDWLEAQLLVALANAQVDSMSSPEGTAYRMTATSVSIADANAFRRHVIGGELWDLVDWRAGKKAIQDYLEEHNELPPGVNVSSIVKLGIRRK